YHEGVDIFHAKAIYMGYPGVFVLEVPVFQAFCAWLYRLFGPHWEIVRAVNICLGAGSAWLIYKISLRFFAPGIAALSAIIYWLAPLNILYQRFLLIDPTTVFFAWGQSAKSADRVY